MGHSGDKGKEVEQGKGMDKGEDKKQVESMGDEGHSWGRQLNVSGAVDREGGSETGKEEEEYIAGNSVYDGDQVGTGNHRLYPHPYDSQALNLYPSHMIMVLARHRQISFLSHQVSTIAE